MTRRPMHPVLLSFVWGCVGVVVIGFFLPWASLDLRTTQAERSIAASIRKASRKTFKKSSGASRSWIHGKRDNGPIIPTNVRGYQVPLFANRKGVKVAMQLVKLFAKTDEQIGWKSYAVYLLPGVAVVCGLLLSAWGGDRQVALAIAIACAAIAGYGCWTLLATDTRKAYAVAIGSGLWLSLAAYAGLSASALLSALPQPLQRRILGRRLAGSGGV